MPRLVSVLIVALALAFGAPALSTTTDPLAELNSTTTAAQIAVLVLEHPTLAANIMKKASEEGPEIKVADVVAAGISSSSPAATISTLVAAACAAVPDDCDDAAEAAYVAAGGTSWEGDGDLDLIIAEAAVTGLETGGATFSESERVEYIRTLSEALNNPSQN